MSIQPARDFNTYTPQEQLLFARLLLQSKGLPITADNLNRAMLSLHTNTELDVSPTIQAVERSIARTIAAPSTARPLPPAPPNPALTPRPLPVPPPPPPPELMRSSNVAPDSMTSTSNGPRRITFEPNPEATFISGILRLLRNMGGTSSSSSSSSSSSQRSTPSSPRTRPDTRFRNTQRNNDAP